MAAVEEEKQNDKEEDIMLIFETRLLCNRKENASAKQILEHLCGGISSEMNLECDAICCKCKKLHTWVGFDDKNNIYCETCFKGNFPPENWDDDAKHFRIVGFSVTIGGVPVAHIQNMLLTEDGFYSIAYPIIISAKAHMEKALCCFESPKNE